MLAAYHGHAPLVKLLLQHGADPNRLNDRGQSPLAGAVFKSESDVVEVCLHHNLCTVARLHAGSNPVSRLKLIEVLGIIGRRSRS